MGSLRKQGANEEWVLSATTRIGRHGSNDLVLSDRLVSNNHAVIEWTTAGAWRLRDLGSRNGTTVSGRPLSPGEWVSLEHGDTVRFADQQETWVFLDAVAPSLEAFNTRTRERRRAQGGTLILCDDPKELLRIVEHQGQWLIEQGGNVHPVSPNQTLVHGNNAWILQPPQPVVGTVSGPDVESCHDVGSCAVDFFVSQDLEHIRIQVRLGERAWTSERAHHWVLLELARARLADRAGAPITRAEEGWIHATDLCSRVGIDSQARLNVEICRIRREAESWELDSASSIVERRRGTGMLRIGTDQVHIHEVARDPRRELYNSSHRSSFRAREEPRNLR